MLPGGATPVHLAEITTLLTTTQNHTIDNTTFAALGVDDGLVGILESDGITLPFPIQAMTIPDALNGDDVCGRAKTGSGKTLAFGLPIIQRLQKARPRRPRAMVLVPTRELAHQVTEVLRPLGRSKGFSLVAVYGGVSMRRQIDKLEKGVEIVVATPGRLIDLMDRKKIHLEDVSVVCIDEADQMADMGFLPQVGRIMRQVPADHQTMLFSATLDGQVGTLIRDYMDDPVQHAIESEVTSVETMEHRFLKVHHMDKIKVAAAIARSAAARWSSRAPSTAAIGSPDSSGPNASRHGPSMVTSINQNARAHSPASQTADHPCSSRPTSQPAAFTSTTSIS